MTEDEIVRIKKCPANSKFQVSLHKNILNFSVIGNDWEAPLFYEVHFPARTKGMKFYRRPHHFALTFLDDQSGSSNTS